MEVQIHADAMKCKSAQLLLFEVSRNAVSCFYLIAHYVTRVNFSQGHYIL